MEPRLSLVTKFYTKPCVFALNMTQEMCPRPGWPYELTVFLISLLSATNPTVVSHAGNISVIRAVSYSANLNVSSQLDLSVMRQLRENIADLSPPYMLLSESRAKLTPHLGTLIRLEPLIFFRKKIVTQVKFSLLQMFSFPYLAMFLLPFMGTWIILRLGLRMQTPRQLNVSNNGSLRCETVSTCKQGMFLKPFLVSLCFWGFRFHMGGMFVSSSCSRSCSSCAQVDS